MDQMELDARLGAFTSAPPPKVFGSIVAQAPALPFHDPPPCTKGWAFRLTCSSAALETVQAAIGEEPEMEYAKLPQKEMLARGCFGDFKGNAQRLKDYAARPCSPIHARVLAQTIRTRILRAPLHQRGRRDADGHALLAWRLMCDQKSTHQPRPREYKKSMSPRNG